MYIKTNMGQSVLLASGEVLMYEYQGFEVIHCLTGGQWREFKVGVTWENKEAPDNAGQTILDLLKSWDILVDTMWNRESQ